MAFYNAGRILFTIISNTFSPKMATNGDKSIIPISGITFRIGLTIGLVRLCTNGETGLPVTITADANTPHQAVVRAMDAAGQTGFVNLSITTRKASAE